MPPITTTAKAAAAADLIVASADEEVRNYGTSTSEEKEEEMAERASAQHTLGKVLRIRGLHQQALKALTAALELRRALQAPATRPAQPIQPKQPVAPAAPASKCSPAAGSMSGALVADTLHELGVLSLRRGQLEEAAQHLRSALDLKRRCRVGGGGGGGGGDRGKKGGVGGAGVGETTLSATLHQLVSVNSFNIYVIIHFSSWK